MPDPSLPDPSSQEIVIAGYGAVTPFGWSVPALMEGLLGDGEVPQAPALPTPPPAWFRHARLRRTSPIAKYVTAVGLEALGFPGDPEGAAQAAPEKLGLVLCIQNGCVNFSKRFYGEVLDTPGFASPILFPETVFNSPASHLAAMLGRTSINYTIIGDAAAFVQGLAIAADWLREGQVDGALVIAGEELDDLTEAAHRLFFKDVRVTAGAGAVYLRRAADGAETAPVTLGGITGTATFADLAGRGEAAVKVAAELRQMLDWSGIPADHAVLVDGALTPNAPETAPWQDWPHRRFSPKERLGEGLSTSGAWQVVYALTRLHAVSEWNRAALVPVIGEAEQAAGVMFFRAGKS